MQYVKEVSNASELIDVSRQNYWQFCAWQWKQEIWVWVVGDTWREAIHTLHIVLMECGGLVISLVSIRWSWALNPAISVALSPLPDRFKYLKPFQFKINICYAIHSFPTWADCFLYSVAICWYKYELNVLRPFLIEEATVTIWNSQLTFSVQEVKSFENLTSLLCNHTNAGSEMKSPA
jgi:hypothetical protein